LCSQNKINISMVAKKAEHTGVSGCADPDLASIPSQPFAKSQNRRSTEADYLGIAAIRPESEPSHSRW
jgi:hypothetical protein